ncbi:MAG: hypothetical protein JWL84_4769 [Rhodospirillales bacterium]|jgi:uncharacterized protein YjeT (DUF2065 family)|nr:hypothetical protein [Rhodospirillales bacterium]
MKEFATGVALALVIEGALYALFPDQMKRMAAAMLALPPPVLRYAGLASVFVGVGIVWALRR